MQMFSGWFSFLGGLGSETRIYRD